MSSCSISWNIDWRDVQWKNVVNHVDMSLDGSIYEKNPLNPQKIDTKGFSIVLGTFRHAK